jgi:DNA-binding MarR family transcriptional regulator
MSDNLGFLIGDVSRLLRRSFDARARTIGVTRPQWRVLTMLTRHEGINQGGLADLIDVEAITLCRMVDRLAEAGLVERRSDPADRRAWRLYLTDKAKPLLDDLKILGEDLFVEAVAGLSEGEQAELKRMLDQVRGNLTTRPLVAANG